MKFHFLTDKQLNKKLEDARVEGYHLAWQLRRIGDTRKGLILNPKAHQQIVEILNNQLKG